MATTRSAVVSLIALALLVIGCPSASASATVDGEVVVTGDVRKPIVDVTQRNPLLSVVILATGADDYTAAVAWGEISPEFAATPVLVAHTEDGVALDRPRLVVPGDVKGGGTSPTSPNCG